MDNITQQIEAKKLKEAYGACPIPSDPEQYAVKPVPVAGSFTTQHILLMIAGTAAIITVLISYFLIHKHLHRYTEPKQQRQIIRIIFVPCVYSILSACSIIDYSVTKYITPIIPLYESFALASLFLLFVEYVAPDKHTRTEYFATLENHKAKNWFKQGGGYRVVPGGSLIWYERKHFFVFLYVSITIAGFVAETVTQALGYWCATSWSPKYAHLWVFVIQDIALSAAVLSIVVFFFRMREEPEFAYHKPGLKLLSFKLIVAVNFFQAIIFGALEIKTDNKLTAYDLHYGIPAALVSVEQVIFAIFFHYSFRSREYHESMKTEMAAPRMGTFRAAANAFNPLDLLQGMILMPKYGYHTFGPKSASSGRGRGRSGRKVDNDHLEPMTQTATTIGYHGQYPSPPAHITVTGPQDTSYSGAYGPPEYSPLAYPDQTTHREPSMERYPVAPYNDTSEEDERLNTRNYSRSRDSSVDFREANERHGV